MAVFIPILSCSGYLIPSVHDISCTSSLFKLLIFVRFQSNIFPFPLHKVHQSRLLAPFTSGLTNPSRCLQYRSRDSSTLSTATLTSFLTRPLCAYLRLSHSCSFQHVHTAAVCHPECRRPSVPQVSFRTVAYCSRAGAMQRIERCQ